VKFNLSDFGDNLISLIEKRKKSDLIEELGRFALFQEEKKIESTKRQFQIFKLFGYHKQ
jgi:hypothetical protein